MLPIVNNIIRYIDTLNCLFICQIIKVFAICVAQERLYRKSLYEITNLPVDLPLDVCDVEEHLLPGEVCGHGQGGHLKVVLDVDGGAAFHGDIKHALQLLFVMKEERLRENGYLA